MSRIGSLLHSSDDLYHASRDNDLAKAKKCLASGVSPNFCRSLGPVWMTPLDMAIVKGKIAMVRLLLDCDANVTGSIVRERAMNPISMQNAGAPKSWSTAFHHAANMKYGSILGLLTERHPRVNVCDSAGDLPLHLAVSKNNFDAAKTLLEGGAHVNAINGKGMTALHASVANGDCVIVQLLINHCCSLNLRDHAKQTALMLAVKNHHNEVLRILASNEADLEMIDEHGFTAFFSAAGSFDITMMKTLNEVGADIEAQDRK